MIAHMSAEVRSIIGSAAKLAAEKEHRRSVQSADLAMALVSSNLSYRFLDQSTRAEMARRLDEILEEERVFGTPVDVYVYSDPVKRILAYALEEAQHNGEVRAQPRHVLIGLLREEDCVAARLFQSYGIDLIRVRSLH